MSKFVAAVVQAAPVWMDRRATTQKACSLIKEAAARGAKVCAFPESFIPAFPYGVWHHGVKRNMHFYRSLTQAAVSLDGPEVGALREAARNAQCVVVMGITEQCGGSLYNSQLFLGADGELLGSRRKLKPTSAERLVWGEGDGSGLRVFDTGETGRLGGLICGEHNLSLARFTMQSQQEQLHVASYPDPMMEGRPFADRVDAAVRHYAAEGQCFVLNATGFIGEDARAALYDTPELAQELDRDPAALHGASSIIGPDGSYLAGPLSGREGVLTAEIDLSRIPLSKFWFDPSGHSGRPDVFDLRVNFSSGGWQKPSDPPAVNGAPVAAAAAAPPATQAARPLAFASAPAPRELGKRVELPRGCGLADVDDTELKDLLHEVWHHGIVTIPDQKLSAAEMVELSRRIGEPVVLPPCFFPGMREPQLPQVCRVGNLRPGAESAEDAERRPELLLTGARFGEYWHHDGNFFAPPRNAVLNTLHAKVAPNVGGKTLFLDPSAALRDAADGPFSAEELEALRHTTLTVSHEWISDFEGAPEEDIVPFGMPHVHDAVQLHPVTGKACLYLPMNPEGLYDQRIKQHWALNRDVWQRLQDAGYYYEHRWQEGEVVLWDNMQVLHKAGGGFGDRPRLLLRTQTIYT